jgi:hypothetical protein
VRQQIFENALKKIANISDTVETASMEGISDKTARMMAKSRGERILLMGKIAKEALNRD